MRGAHSYEEPAFDLYPLMTAPSPKVGEGRVGTLSEAIFLESFAIQVKQSLRCGPIQVIGDLARQVKRVAIVCGAGGEFLSDAIRARADVFLTGEMRFHDHLAARAKGIALLLPGHHATERPGVDDLARRLKSQWPDLDVWASDKEVDPVTWV
jgi:putative NIF3 family GTP cyclohydrolase 1 type 2